MSSTSAGSFPKANLVRYCGQYGMAIYTNPFFHKSSAPHFRYSR
ncbi:hypothetical protein T4B_4491 [Trichinella pseudospiralis]|uniref:Uncharacterized protein n=1 Tax=Trichinella pseudospiralis TaxID=6337 RepID=A0A0V1KG81_TRIPS|nr:hypothetical protein T4B_4491 [Trichinella pseudospiralis]KRZ46194.1 hypothetical protein T4C_1694 [Trichinella pseudospiralis]